MRKKGVDLIIVNTYDDEDVENIMKKVVKGTTFLGIKGMLNREYKLEKPLLAVRRFQMEEGVGKMTGSIRFQNLSEEERETQDDGRRRIHQI